MVRLGALGDVVRTLPAVSSLRAAWPGAHLAWLVEPAAAGAVEGQPWVDEVIVHPRPAIEAALRRRDGAGAARELMGLVRRLRARRFEWVIDFHSIARSALLARSSGAPRRVGYARPAGRELSWCLATDRARLPPGRISRFERNQALVRFLGVDAPPDPEPFRVAPEGAVRMQTSLGLGPRPVVLHPGSSGRTRHKRWPAAGFAAVARRLAADGLPCVVSRGPAAGEEELAEAVVEASQGAARLAPETPRVADLGALLRAARAYVGADTGPMHVASLVGTPVVQLLGPTDPIENAPWPRTPSRTLRAADGSMRIDVEAVANAVHTLT